MDINPPNEKNISMNCLECQKSDYLGANHFISKMPFDSSCWIVWDKDNGNTDFSDCELAWTSFSTARKIKYRWNGMLQAKYETQRNRIHPTQKPVALYEWLLNRYAKPGDIILDTHVGSASSLIACYRTNHPYVGLNWTSIITICPKRD